MDITTVINEEFGLDLATLTRCTETLQLQGDKTVCDVCTGPPLAVPQFA